jgi:hypothetical protein
MPPTKKQIVATQLLAANWSVPLMPCPLVQPPAQRAPTPIKIPPMSAVIRRGSGIGPKVAAHVAGTHCNWNWPETRAEMNEPITMPGTSIQSQVTVGATFL